MPDTITINGDEYALTEQWGSALGIPENSPCKYCGHNWGAHRGIAMVTENVAYCPECPNGECREEFANDPCGCVPVAKSNG